MKRFLLMLALACATAAQASDLDFKLRNDTGRDFEAVYVTAADNKDWDANLLESGKVLKPGGETLVRFGNDQKAVIWDFNIIDAQGLAVRFDKVNLLNVHTITLTEKDGKVTAEIE